MIKSKEINTGLNNTSKSYLSWMIQQPRKKAEKLTRISNRFTPHSLVNETAASLAQHPNKLSNNFSDLGFNEITIGFTEKVSPRAFMEGMGAFNEVH